MTPQSPILRGPQSSASTRRDPQDGSRVPVLPNTLLSASAERSGHPKDRESGAPAAEESQISVEAPSGTWTRERPHTANPPFLPARPTMFLALWASLPASAPRKDPPGRTSTSASQGAPAAGLEEGGSEGQEVTTLVLPALGSSGASTRQAGWTGAGPPLSPQPGQEGAWAEEGAATSLSAGEWERPAREPSWPPRATSMPMAQEATGILPLSAWQPLLDATEPSPTWLATLPTASGPKRDVATGTTGRAQPLPPTGNTVLFQMEGGVPWEQPGGRTDSEGLAPHLVEETSPPETGTSGGRFSPGAFLAPSPMPSSSSHAELGQAGERTGSLGAPNPNISLPLWWETEPPWEAASARERWGEPAHTAPFSASSSQGETPLLLHWGGFSPSLADDPHELPASTPPPGEHFTPLPLSPAWRSAGQPSREEDQAPLHSSTGPPAVVGTAPSPVVVLPANSSAAPRKEGAPREPSRKPADPGALTPRPPPRPTAGAAFATVAPSPTQAVTVWGEGLRTAPTNSAKSPHPLTAKEGAPRQAWEGTWSSRGSATGASEPPSSGSPGREGGSPGQPPARAGPPTSSAEAASSATRLLLSAAPSAPPEFHSKSLAFSAPPSETVAALTRATGTTVTAPNPPSTARHHAWTSSARTWRWEGGEQPRSPTESLWKEIIQQSPGAAQTAAALLSESPLDSSSSSRSGQHPWPPKPTPELDSRREGPRRATTGLSAAGPEEATKATTQLWPATPRERHPRGHPVFVVENQPPLLKATFLPIPCELVLAMEFSRSFQDPESPEYQSLARSINETVTPLFASLPGFQRLEVKTIRPGSVVVEFDALFLPQAPGLWAALNRSSLSERLPPGLWVANARVLRSVTQERRLDPCAVLFSCHAGYECLAEEDGNARCVSLCHRDYCKNQGICTHVANHTPVCQCPVGHDFWFLGVHCDYKVTQQGLLGVACGLLLSLVVLGVVVAGLVMRRVRLLLLEARADQTKSSYRRFCRLDDVSAHYWSEPWLASTTSLDNPAFSNSEELLHLQMLEPACYGCQEDGGAPDGRCRRTPDAPRGICAAGRPSSRYNWAESSSSVNDPMVDSGKASEVSFSSWPMEPIQWSPFPAQHKLPRDQAPRAPRPNSCCEGMELVNLERSWTA